MAQRASVIPAQRGEIYDRHFDVPLVMNIPSFAVLITPALIDKSEREDLYLSLSKVLEITPDEIRNRIPPSTYHLYEPLEVKDSVDFEIITFIAENIESFPGVSWTNKPIRSYLETGSIAHILGIVGNISSEDLQ